MTMRFEFAAASRIIFGQGSVKELPALASEMGKRSLLVTGRNAGRAAPLARSLSDVGIEVLSFGAAGEPTVDSISEGVQLARENDCDFVIGMGGGSAIDTAKAISALLTNGGDVLDYLEVIGQGRPLQEAPVPCVAVPTTAGTGAEVTKNAVLLSRKHEVKVSLRSPLMLPRLAVVDPELTCSMPPSVTASTGLDALSQVLEPFVSAQSNPLTDAVCREGLRRARSLRRAFEDGNDASARENMALASLFGGLALANAKLGAVHGFAGVIGGMFPIPHGVICGRLLPFVMEANVKALRRNASQQFLLRYDEIAEILTGKLGVKAEDGIAWVYDLCDTLDVPRLSVFGITSDHFPELVERTMKASSTKGNPVGLTGEELTEILRKAVSS